MVGLRTRVDRLEQLASAKPVGFNFRTDTPLALLASWVVVIQHESGMAAYSGPWSVLDSYTHEIVIPALCEGGWDPDDGRWLGLLADKPKLRKNLFGLWGASDDALGRYWRGEFDERHRRLCAKVEPVTCEPAANLGPPPAADVLERELVRWNGMQQVGDEPTLETAERLIKERWA